MTKGFTIGDWTRRLEALAARPLVFRPDFPDVAARWEAWWRFEADRPLLVASARKDPSIRWDKAFDLLDRPEEWLAVRRRQVEATHYVGEAVPFIRVDIGPVALAAFLGAPLHLAQKEQTSWHEPIVEAWDDLSFARLDRRNPELAKVLSLMALVAGDAAGCYAVCTPDLTGAVDTLSNLRSPERLCVDLFDHRGVVARAALAVVDAWQEVFALMHDTVLERGAPIVQWLGCWSSVPYALPTCDFNALIGPRDFVETCLPSLAEQARRARRCVFHLDGPLAARHAPALAAEPAITAIQYTPGAGTPSAVAEVSMLRAIQEAGKPVYVVCPKDEVEVLAGDLDPRGLVLCPENVATASEADRLCRVVEAHHA